MEPWQKVLLLASYPDLRNELDPLVLMDQLIVSGVVATTHRETIIRLKNRHERVGWLMWHLVKETDTEASYSAFMEILKDQAGQLFEKLKAKEDSLKRGKQAALPKHVF